MEGTRKPAVDVGMADPVGVGIGIGMGVGVGIHGSFTLSCLHNIL